MPVTLRDPPDTSRRDSDGVRTSLWVATATQWMVVTTEVDTLPW